MTQTIGIVGTGQMGTGIAQVCAKAGLHVLLHDVRPEAIVQALIKVAKDLEKQVVKATLTESEKQTILKRLSPAPTKQDLKACDLVIEAATENETIKRQILQEITENISKQALLVTNTSSLSITSLATSLPHPDLFMGMHFMNPVPIMPLVELIPGAKTAPSTLKTIQELAQKLGKQTVVSRDVPGFIVNRLLIPLINEAIFLLQDQVASNEDIDKALKLGANFPMGPLALADFIGLDTCLAIMQILQKELKDEKYRPCPMLIKYVEAGRLGRKTQKGFYEYP